MYYKVGVRHLLVGIRDRVNSMYATTTDRH